MLKINVVAVGKVKEKYFSDGINEYVKRMSRYCDFTLTEVAEENYSKADEGTIRIIKEKEGERILPHLKGHVVAMAIEGKKFSSEKFAKHIDELATSGAGTITFVIGGSYGISDKIKGKANELISFSDMTFPHTMFRLMLVEQIYRALSLLSGSNYHK